jgi:hypothetical protein
MKLTHFPVLFILSLLFICSVFGQKPVGKKALPPKTFTVNRECDGGLCHFEIVSFNYGKISRISVGIGGATLSYYFSVMLERGKNSKEYIYHDTPTPHFIEKNESLFNDNGCYCTHVETGERIVDEKLNKLLLDTYNLGNVIVNSNMPIRNKTFSEIGKYAVLASLNKYFVTSQIQENRTTNLQQYADKDLSVLLKEVPEIGVRLKSLLGANYKLFMNNLTVSADLVNKQGFLVMHGLAAHMGGIEEAVFLISLSDQKLHCAILSRRFGDKYKIFSEDSGSVPISLLDELFYAR